MNQPLLSNHTYYVILLQINAYMHLIFFFFDRSSQDDYCPPEQVESIQNSVLEILQDLYLEIDLTIDYA